jgi:senataxin
MVLREKGIVMLQGPPGTGKTSTLMGLLSAQFEYLKRTGDNRKIMICAPSNAAVDHIVKRLLSEGLINGEGDIIFPNAIRVGIVDTLDEVVRGVSLDDLC